MTDTEHTTAPLAQHIASLNVDLSVRIGTSSLSVAQLSKLAKGSTIDLREGVDQPLDLCANGQVIARGQLEEAEGSDQLVLRITETLSAAGQ